MIPLLIRVIHFFFAAYTLLIFVRVIGSWFPRFAYHPVMRFVRMWTEPYLGVFRRIIPPLGGTIDLSPMIAFFSLGIVEKVLISFIGVFV